MYTKEKLAWRNRIAELRAWNKFGLETRRLRAGQKSHQQRWQEYIEIMEFGLKLKPRPSRHEQQAKAEELEKYYRQIIRFEQRRS